jgi:phospholipid:diacylglycerol acyltransferase
MADVRRRRVPGKGPPEEQESSLGSGDNSSGTVEHVHVVKHIDQPKTRKRRNTFIFFLGSLFGLIAAGFFAKSTDLIDFPEIGEISVDSLLEALPAGFVADIRDLLVSWVLESQGRHRLIRV